MRGEKHTLRDKFSKKLILSKIFCAQSESGGGGHYTPTIFFARFEAKNYGIVWHMDAT